jgi:hypothetical protein
MASTKPLESFEVVSSSKDTEKLSTWTLVSTLGGTAGISLIAAFVAGIFQGIVVFAIAGLVIISMAAVVYEYLGGVKFIPHIVGSILVGCVIGVGMFFAFAERPRPSAPEPNYTSTQNSQPKEMTLYVTEIRACEVSDAKASGAGRSSFTVSYQEKCEFCQATGSKREYLIKILSANFYSESVSLREFKCLQCRKENKPMVGVNTHKGRVQVR